MYTLFCCMVLGICCDVSHVSWHHFTSTNHIALTEFCDINVLFSFYEPKY